MNTTIQYIQIKNKRGGGCGTVATDESVINFWNSRTAESDSVDVPAKLAMLAPALLSALEGLLKSVEAHDFSIGSDIYPSVAAARAAVALAREGNP